MHNLTCKICNNTFNTKRIFGRHLYLHKISTMEYYDKYLKQSGDDICVSCGKQTSFNRNDYKYKKYCSIVCAAKSDEVYIKKQETCLKHFGVTHQSKSPIVRETIIKTWNKRYGTSHPLKNKEVNERRMSTNRRRYGVDNTLSVKSIIEARKKTNIKKYGSENVMQNPEIFHRCISKMTSTKIYTLPSGNTINIQGFEPQFLDYVFTNNILKENEIIYTPSPIEYTLNNKKHKYYPDFYIPKWNMIVEIKSSYVLEQLQTKENYKAKVDACISTGFNYKVIIDNKFEMLKD